MRVCIIGGGNIGTAMAAYFSKNCYEVMVYSSRHEEFGKEIEAIDSEYGTSFFATIYATNDLKYAVGDADIICVTYPSFMIESVFKQLCPLLKKETIIGVIPGTGGVEFFREIVDGHTVFGLDRVPCIARIKMYGKSVYHSKKKSVRLAAFPKKHTKYLCDILSKALGIDCFALDNYLTLTLTPSNPILHTTRTYTMLQNYEKGVFYPREFLFYKEWNDRASEFLLGMDNELQQICSSLWKIDLSGVISVMTHYESKTIKELTKKITSIKSLSKITFPMKESQNGFVPNFASRYFIEDVPYGLTILKGFAQITDVKTPYMDEVLRWNGKKMEEEYIDKSGKILLNNKAVFPQKFGIKTVEDIYNFYLE